MPDTLSLTLFGLFTLLALLRLAECLFIVRYIRRVGTEPLADDESPPVLVVLCLRGGDPFLSRTLRALIAQGYPNFRVRIIVDSPEDEAHQNLREVLGEPPPEHVEVRTLMERHQTCTFKMSGILHGTVDLPEDVALVALMDGDTVPHASWLRELATPIVRGDAAVTTGNRWFSPDRPTLGSMCRFWWNAAAVPQMTFFHMPWGGTMAIRRDLITDERLRDRLQHACSEDTTVGQFAREQGHHVHFEPSLVILNREEIDLTSFFNFETRQLLFTRLEFRPYRWMVLIGLASIAVVIYPLTRACGLARQPVDGCGVRGVLPRQLVRRVRTRNVDSKRSAEAIGTVSSVELAPAGGTQRWRRSRCRCCIWPPWHGPRGCGVSAGGGCGIGLVERPRSKSSEMSGPTPR